MQRYGAFGYSHDMSDLQQRALLPEVGTAVSVGKGEGV